MLKVEYEIFEKLLNMHTFSSGFVAFHTSEKILLGDLFFFTQVDSCSSMQIDSFSTLHTQGDERGERWIKEVEKNLMCIPDFNVKN